jgi:hypothetical protein
MEEGMRRLRNCSPNLGWDRKAYFLNKRGYTSTLTVPATPDGLLAEKVRRNLEQGRQPAGTKVKVLEDGGRGVRHGFVRSNQFPREKCQRVNCQLCFQQDGKRSMCEKENVGYEGECTRCPPRTNAYIGETNHDWIHKALGSWMWEHTRDSHAGIVGSSGGMKDYKVKVVDKFQKCLYRQVDEDVRMQEFEAGGGVLLNSKYEYFMSKSVQPVFRQQ